MSYQCTDFTPGDAPVPVGSVVEYSGSQEHGRYRVIEHLAPASHPQHPLSQEEAAEVYPDGVAYDLWPEHLPYKFGFRHYGYRFGVGTIETRDEDNGRGWEPMKRVASFSYGDPLDGSISLEEFLAQVPNVSLGEGVA